MSMRHVKPGELQNVIDLVSSAFLYNRGESVLRDFPLLYSSSNINHLYVYEEGSQIVAHAGFYLARMKLEGSKLPVAGIGGVCTLPEMQGKGLASSLVEQCIEAARKSGAALAFLWTDKHDFYRKLGFELIGRQWCIELKQDLLIRLRAQMAAQDSFRFSKERDDAFYQQSLRLQSAQALGIVRTHAEHHALLESSGCHIFSAWQEERLAAYFVVGKGKDLQGYIHEWAGEENGLLALLAELPHLGSDAKYLLSPQFMLQEEAWIYTLDKLEFPMTAQYMGMAKILNFEKVQSVVQSYLVHLGIDPRKLSLTEHQGIYMVDWCGVWRKNFSEHGIIQFLFGSEPAPQNELANIFPMRLWYWGSDSV